jgi:hypothetical protein
MTQLGLWAPYINEAEIRSWYRTLPSAVEAECKTYVPDGTELDPLPDFSRLQSRVERLTDSSVKRFNPPFHNPQVHFIEVKKNGRMAADACGLPQAVRESLELALYAHDLGHCGSTFRCDAPKGVYRQDLGVDVSSEWVSAVVLEEELRKADVCLPSRLFQMGIIFATTMGAASPAGKRMRLPSPQPRTISGCIMWATDICPTGDPFEDIRRAILVNFAEVPAFPRAKTWEGFIAGEQNFCDVIKMRFDRLNAVASKSVTGKLGWDARLQRKRRGIEQLRDRSSQIAKFAAAELKKSGFELA